jgi:hypothetical protein
VDCARLADEPTLITRHGCPAVVVVGEEWSWAKKPSARPPELSIVYLEVRMITETNLGARWASADLQVTERRHGDLNPGGAVRPNRISSSGRSRPDRLKLDRLP